MDCGDGCFQSCGVGDMGLLDKEESFFDVLVLKLTDKAALLEFEGEEEWVPRSAMIVEDDALDEAEGDPEMTIEVGIANWKAEQLGWL